MAELETVPAAAEVHKYSYAPKSTVEFVVLAFSAKSSDIPEIYEF